MVVRGRSVFISYRRQLSWQLAQLVHHKLVEHNFDAFMDFKNLDSGVFDRRILSEIEAREHFIVLLEPGSLDRIGEDGDWLRREITHALAHGRNVVPVTASGFEFRRDLVLPPDVARLPSFNGVAVARQPEYFNAAMKRLRTRFLKMPPKPAALPPHHIRSVVEPGRQALTLPGSFTSGKALVLPAPQLTGQVENPTSTGLAYLLAKDKLVRLTWSEIPGADEYVLERRAIGSASLPTGILFEVYRGPDRSFGDTIYKFDAVIVLRYRVRASASGQRGMWSDTLELRADFGK